MELQTAGKGTTSSKAEDEEAVADSTTPIKTEKPIFVNNLAESMWQNVQVILNETIVSSPYNLYPYKTALEVDFSSDAQ